MAVYGIGAYYKGRGDVSRESIDNGFCGFGYTEEEQPALYELMRQVSPVSYTHLDVYKRQL